MTVAEMRLVDVAREIGPALRQLSDEAEQRRRLPQKALAALADAGLQRMLLPKSLGGLEVDPVTCAHVIEEVARFDTAAAWALQSNSGAFWSARLPDEGAEEIYLGHPDAIVAAAFHPPQQAVEVPGGYRITGRAPLASLIHDSDWLMLTAMIMDGGVPRMVNGTPDVVALMFRTQEAEIIDTWHTLGMRGTDSNDVAVKDLFVPKSRTFQLTPEFTPGCHFQGSLYRFPGAAETAAIVAPVLLATARNAIDEFLQLAGAKTPLGSMKLLRDRSVVQSNIGRAEGSLRSARAYFYDALGRGWQQTLAGAPLTIDQKAELMLAGLHAAESSWQVVDVIHRLAGTSGIYTRSRLERLLRDALTLRHHGFISESKYETVGQVYLGLPPEFVLVHF